MVKNAEISSLSDHFNGIHFFKQVMLAADKEQGNMREDREDEKLLRIFIKVPKSHTEEMIKDYFKVRR